MRLLFPNLLGGLLVMALLAGCNPPKSDDDGSGPRVYKPAQTQAGSKSPKPPMDASKYPPAPPPKPPGASAKDSQPK